MEALATVGKTVIIYKDRFTYNGWPSITVLDNGEWLVGWDSTRLGWEKIVHSPSDPLYRTRLSRSSDQGKTWEEPYFVPNFDCYGTEVPGVAQLRNGTVVLIHFRFGWYTLGEGRKRREAGEPISICLPGRGFTEDFTDDDWDRAELGWARGYHGLYCHLSTDRGHTFEDTIKIDTSPYRNGLAQTGVIELQDGRIAYVVTEHIAQNTVTKNLDPINRHTYLLCSSTGGKSWDPPTLVVDSPEGKFTEPAIAEVAPGELYCVLRADDWQDDVAYWIEIQKNAYLYACRSLDGGKTWSKPEATTMFGLPGHLLNLRDGRLLCTYGRRTEPFGIRACLSEDGGRTWKIDQEIVIRDNLPNFNLGYPSTTEYAPGKLLASYYGEDDGVTCIQGTYVTLT